MRQYCKQHSSRLWSLESKRFANMGLRLCHPLAFDKHPLNVNKGTKDYASLASLALRIMEQGTYGAEQQKEFYGVLTSMKEFRDLVTLPPLSQLLKHVENNRLRNILTILGDIDILYATTTITLNKTKHKATALKTYNILSPAIMSVEKKTIKEFKM